MKKHIGRAFAPGHLTAFFMIADSPQDPIKKGSLGAGICLSKGATTEVIVGDGPASGEAGSDTIRILINNEVREASVTTLALTELILFCRSKGWIPEDKSLGINVDTALELPERNGWGMSGAGALSSVLALKDALNLPLSFYQVSSYAHITEVRCSTGLGDVAAQCTGGVPIRKRPGFPPHGFIDSIPVPPTEVVCLSLSEPLSTPDILQDPVSRERITAAGRNAVDGITWFPSLDMLMEYAKGFTLASGVASHEVVGIISQIEKEGIGKAGMAMLGNSVFAIGDTHRLEEMMSPFGRVDVCDIDPTGARVMVSKNNS